MTWDEPTVSTLKAYRVWPPTAYQQHGDGPARVVTDQPDESFRACPVGFAPSGRHRAAVEVDSPSLSSSWLWPPRGGVGGLRVAPPPGVHRRKS